jgi:hypothetical protein
MNIGDFTIKDLVLPIIGSDANFPKNKEIRELYD